MSLAEATSYATLELHSVFTGSSPFATSGSLELGEVFLAGCLDHLVETFGAGAEPGEGFFVGHLVLGVACLDVGLDQAVNQARWRASSAGRRLHFMPMDVGKSSICQLNLCGNTHRLCILNGWPRVGGESPYFARAQSNEGKHNAADTRTLRGHSTSSSSSRSDAGLSSRNGRGLPGLRG